MVIRTGGTIDTAPARDGGLPGRRTAQGTELRWHIWGVWTAFAAVLLSATNSDPDLWGHVRFGLDWLRDRTLPTVDPYSFTQDKPWINHEWLSEAAMGAAYALGGSAGLVLLKIAVLAVGLMALARRLEGLSPLVRAALLTVAIACTLPISLTVRPHLWSVSALVLLVSLVDRRDPPGVVRIAAGACLFAAWANLHGGWITGAAVLCGYVGVRVLRTRHEVRRWAALVSASLLATLLNPYGVGLWAFLATTVRPARPDIVEWQPLGFESPLIVWVPVVLTCALTAYLWRRPHTRPRAEVMTAVVLLVMAAARVNRVAPLMAAAALALLGPCLRRAWEGVGHLRVGSAAAATMLCVPVAVAVFTAATPTVASFTCLPIRDSWAPDLEAAATLKGAGGRLVTTFDWGQYAIWHFGPDLRVSVDGRRETVYSDDVVQWHRAFERGDIEGQEVVAALRPHYVWLPADRLPVREWLLGSGYRLDVSTEASFVGVRHDLPPLQRALPLSSCFP